MSKQPPAYQTPPDLPADARIAIVAARYNGHIVDELLAGCLARLTELGLPDTHVQVHRVPGAFELPVTAKLLARTGAFSAIICLGCVIRGQTAHFEHVAGQAARGIQDVALSEAMPVIFAVLTTETEQQALDRAGGAHGHAGRSAAEAALEMIALCDRIGRA
jgi:6,7-dimethyl-8-ribityllumazine synthase